MNEIPKRLQTFHFSKKLLESMPCGIVVIDESGLGFAVNDISGILFGNKEMDMCGRGKMGKLFRCVYALGENADCGAENHCEHCELRNIALSSISKKKPRKGNVTLRVVVDQQVRDVRIKLSAVPFTYDNEKYSLLVAEQNGTFLIAAESAPENSFHGIVGRNKKMLALFDTIRQIAKTNEPVLIQGESGVGKELVALAIHRESDRAQKNFVPVNCAALPDGLLETELFGHVKGAFTGAAYHKKGRFGIADGGTIFLDEIGELKLDLQAKFLRVLEQGGFEPVGSDRTVNVDVRVVSATNRMLENEMEAGNFRGDLYYRLCVMPLEIPPLRKRADDIPVLADYFLKHELAIHREGELRLSPNCLRVLKRHRWPGNVRELKNVLKYAVIKSGEGVIEPEHLPNSIPENGSVHPPRRRRKSKLNEDVVKKALQQARGNKLWAAELLGVSRSTLYRFMEKDYGFRSRE